MKPRAFVKKYQASNAPTTQVKIPQIQIHGSFAICCQAIINPPEKYGGAKDTIWIVFLLEWKL
jgi:hypothetical protein